VRVFAASERESGRRKTRKESRFYYENENWMTKRAAVEWGRAEHRELGRKDPECVNYHIKGSIFFE
jgi:hypothetical protein